MYIVICQLSVCTIDTCYIKRSINQSISQSINQLLSYLEMQVLMRSSLAMCTFFQSDGWLNCNLFWRPLLLSPPLHAEDAALPRKLLILVSDIMFVVCLFLNILFYIILSHTNTAWFKLGACWKVLYMCTSLTGLILFGKRRQVYAVFCIRRAVWSTTEYDNAYTNHRPAEQYSRSHRPTHQWQRISTLYENEWMNEWINEKKIYIARLKAYKCMLNLSRLAEN